MSRTLIYATLSADAASAVPGSLGALGVVPEAVGAAESVDSPRSHPFITTRWGNVSVGVGPSHIQLLDVWVHDDSRDYLRIDGILNRVKALLEAIESMHFTEGWITQIEWQGSSPDLRDDGYDTVTRNSTFKVIGSTR